MVSIFSLIEILIKCYFIGPPPVSKAVIDSLQVVEVNDEQVGQNLQCSVCWEHFQLKEQVRYS